MSQIYIPKTTGSTPTVPTSFATDDGTAVPAANVITILGAASIVYDANGISTSGAGSTVTVLLNNRIQGTASTAGAVSADLLTFDLGAAAGVYGFAVAITGFDSFTPSGANYKIDSAARTTGAAGLLLDVDVYPQEEAAFAPSVVTSVVSGNNLIFRVTGVSGLNINWALTGYYEKVL